MVVGDHAVSVHAPSTELSFAPDDCGDLSVRRGWFVAALTKGGKRVLKLPGLSRADAASLDSAIRRCSLSPQIAAAVRWHDDYHRLIATALADQRWISREQLDELTKARPPGNLAGEVAQLGLEPTLSTTERGAIALLEADLSALVAANNETILAAEMRDRRAFFDRIESSPLTDEQAHAVVCFDNRVQVLAAAGSGKTSLMVARAAYAIDRGFVAPDRVLLLAFNTAAAAELQERIDTRLRAAGISSEGVRASTFHSFGLDVLGKATGHKPRLADWATDGRQLETVMRIVDELRDRDHTFRYRWDLYRLLFASAPNDLVTAEPDGYDKASKVTGYRTMRGEVVRSAGERMIADWLYLNGVRYEYERPYVVEVSDETHSQYRPDFYYPDIDAWHEHWAVGRDGTPPAEFEGYAEGMAWKRQLHTQHRTTLIETTWAGVMFDNGLERLAAELTSRGIELDWNPDRPVSNVRPLQHDDLARLVRTFMTHVKSNALSPARMLDRLQTGHQRLAGFRTQLFLDLYWPIHDEWNRRLRAENAVDFEDMLVLAAEHLEAGVDMGYELILVDEFQDASQARARLVRALLQRPGRYLLAVGDDWQAINRFAGADLSVMLDFERWFGAGPTLRLSTTFRCPQSICDVASRFVTANPKQFTKTVRSVQPPGGSAVTLVSAPNTAAAVATTLERLSRDVETQHAGSPPARKPTVNVLGRYRHVNDVVPPKTPANLDVRFRTVHGSKGLEADYVLIPGLVTGTYGFPSSIADSPVLDLAMAANESFPHAEERRLFYVALTRARRHVTVFTEPGKESPFAVELVANHTEVATTTHEGAPVTLIPCVCGKGTMVPRTGKYGDFLGCSRFPMCTNTAK